MQIVITWEQRINMSDWIVRAKIVDTIDAAHRTIQTLKEFGAIIRNIRSFSANEMNL